MKTTISRSHREMSHREISYREIQIVLRMGASEIDNTTKTSQLTVYELDFEDDLGVRRTQRFTLDKLEDAVERLKEKGRKIYGLTFTTTETRQTVSRWEPQEE